MSNLSVGFFDPSMLAPDTDVLAQAIRHTFRRQVAQRPSFPLHVASIARSNVSYALVGGHIPMHRDPVGDFETDGRLFQLVLATWNRPVLLTATDTPEHKALIGGESQAWNGLGMGAIEMRAGMALHFDITTLWHGVTSFVQEADERAPSRALLPQAVIIQVAGFDAGDIDGAVLRAIALVTADVATSTAGAARG